MQGHLVDVPRLRIDPIERGFFQHKKCFTQCIKKFDNNDFTDDEKRCVKACLYRYRETQRYMIEKAHSKMQQQVSMDPGLRQLYEEQKSKTITMK